MSKINSAIHEIHHMDTLAARNQWVNQIHPLVKFVLTVLYIITVVSFSKYDFWGLAGMAVYPVMVFLLAELSFAESLRKLRIVLPLVCIVGLFNPFFDRVPVDLGFITINAGVISMLTLMMKGIFSVLASYLLIATTSVEKICYALGLLHCPSILITQFLLTYRYITVLLEEVNRITQAYALRAPKQKGIHIKVWGSLTGQLLLHSVDRASSIYDSMELRGYRGSFRYLHLQTRAQWMDYLYLAFWLILFLFFRSYPVIWILGTLF